MSSTKNNIFQFKEFAINQSGCAMKINTDGVLLGALIETENPKSILDIGTGTGVIALMLAQRFPLSKIDAVEIDENAAQTAADNFSKSVFADRLKMHSNSFEDYFNQYPTVKFDLIISNPPFFMNSLRSPSSAKEIARHTDKKFFEELIEKAVLHLETSGVISLILPLETAEVVKGICIKSGLYLQKQVLISSFYDSTPHRELITYGFQSLEIQKSTFVIYEKQKEYSKDYKELLKNFLTIF